jgi:hypothetical protein
MPITTTIATKNMTKRAVSKKIRLGKNGGTLGGSPK